ncbi:MAG: transcription termination factor NusA [Clostridia bacterium]|nr:transcription termination factor NusA [Clostridia bacterium]MDD4376283.1 transcription termination factor NusA [Clostridia bacterium]
MKVEKVNAKELLQALEELQKERGITKEYMIESLKMALEAAYKKNYETNEEVNIDINEETGNIKVYAVKKIVSEVEDKDVEISIDDAKEISKRAKLGNDIKIEVTPKNFGRIAASSGKQIIIQRVREAEKDLIMTQYNDKQGEIVVGVVQRSDKIGMIIDLGKVEAIIPAKELVPTEIYESHQRIKAFVLSVEDSGRFGPQVILSRRSPNFVRKLFELEVPEIEEGLVEIRGVAREAGFRTKIAVWSNDENIDPIGACIGKKGIRKNAISEELFGEKIDIIAYTDDLPSFIVNALSPAEILAIDLNEEENIATIVVPDDKFALAIGARGQNVKLAAILTGWKIDIKKLSDVENQIIE